MTPPYHPLLPLPWAGMPAGGRRIAPDMTYMGDTGKGISKANYYLAHRLRVGDSACMLGFVADGMD